MVDHFPLPVIKQYVYIKTINILIILYYLHPIT